MIPRGGVEFTVTFDLPLGTECKGGPLLLLREEEEIIGDGFVKISFGRFCRLDLR